MTISASSPSWYRRRLYDAISRGDFLPASPEEGDSDWSSGNKRELLPRSVSQMIPGMKGIAPDLDGF